MLTLIMRIPVYLQYSNLTCKLNYTGDYLSRVILILMKVGILTSTWFQVVPFCSLISEQFLFSVSNDFLRRL